MNAQKQALREKYLRICRAMSSAEKSASDACIAARVLQSDAYRSAKTIFCYISLPHEVDTLPILFDAWMSGKRVASPRCRPDGHMSFYLIAGISDISCGIWGIPEPNTECPLCLPDETTLCIVPAVAADTENYRLGHGCGYYDRYLASFPVRTLGICYASCVFPVLPREPFDRPIDFWITDEPAKEV